MKNAVTTAIAVAVGCTAALVAGAGIVFAHSNYPDSAAINDYPDNREHWGCLNQSGDIPIALWDHLEYFEATAPGTGAGHGNMILRWQAPCTSHTDVWFDAGLNNSSLGVEFCAAFSSSGGCDRAIARLNPTVVASTAAANSITFDRQAQKTWCHEMGHTLGFDHWLSTSPPPGQGTQDCQRQGQANFVGWNVYNADRWLHLVNDL